MEKYSFFDSTVDDQRLYSSADFAQYFNALIKSGVFQTSEGLRVTQASPQSMNIILKAGFAYINGYLYQNTADLAFQVPVTDGLMGRIDRVVIQLNLTERKITAVYKTGTPSTNPIAPDLERSEIIYELCVGEIRIDRNAARITQDVIRDTRGISELCGWVTGLIEQADTTAIFNEFHAWFENKTSEYENWFNAKKADYEGESTAKLEEAQNAWSIFSQSAEEWLESMKEQVQNDDHTLMNERLETLEDKAILTGEDEPNPAEFKNRLWFNGEELFKSVQEVQEDDTVVYIWDKVSSDEAVLPDNLLTPEKIGFGGRAIDISESDLNELAGQPSGYYAGSNMTNAPSNSWYHVLHMQWDDIRAYQVAYRQSPTYYGEVWVRNYDKSGTGDWRAWERQIIGSYDEKADKYVLPKIKMPKDVYKSSGGALDMSNSDIIGLNALIFADIATGTGEGLLFINSNGIGVELEKLTSSMYDTWHVRDAVEYINENPTQQAGHTTVSGKAWNVVSKRVYYKHAFKSAPIVTATAQTAESYDNIVEVTVNNVTASYFDVVVYAKISKNVRINWMALPAT